MRCGTTGGVPTPKGLNATLRYPCFAFAATTLLLSACSSEPGGARGGAGSGGRPAPEAGFVELHTESVPLRIELPGRTTAFETSEVRPQVSGIVKERLFTEGALVKAGDLLYRIDPRLYESALNQARADFNSAVATADAAEVRAERIAQLAKEEVVSRQDLLDAQSAAAAAAAAAAAGERAHAGVESAQINLKFTRVSAPIGGRIGRSLVTTGALVTANQTQALTTIFRLDPMFVDIQQSSADYLALRRALTKGDVASTAAQVSLTLEDGSVYTEPGILLFAEAMVDPSTGSVTLRARFPNPSGLLLPGMYVRASLSQVTVRDAILVPQQAVARDPRGQATVMLVGPEDKAVARTVEAETTVGDKWLVRSGLVPGDRVIVEGLGRIRAGQKVRPVPIATSARNAETPPVPKPK